MADEIKRNPPMPFNPTNNGWIAKLTSRLTLFTGPVTLRHNLRMAAESRERATQALDRVLRELREPGHPEFKL